MIAGTDEQRRAFYVSLANVTSIKSVIRIITRIRVTVRVSVLYKT